MRTSDFKDRWNEFRGQNGFLQRLDPNHPLDFFIGISHQGHDELVLMTTIEPVQLKATRSLGVEKNIRKDGKWATQICLLDDRQQDIFARFCMDLVECSQTSKSEAEGLSNVAKRYLTWQRLFLSMHEGLSIKELKGLVGEILFARYLIENQKYSKDDVMEAWRGPDYGDRDYIFQDVWYEVKGISTGKDYVTISSLNQLETEKGGYLVVIRVDETSATDGESFSFRAYIEAFRELLQDAPKAADMFEKKLLSAKYMDKKQYEEIYFRINGKEYFRVDETFPRLVTENVSSEILRVQYDLSIAGIQPWKTKEDALWN